MRQPGDTLTPVQEEFLKKVKEKGEKYCWWRGVCLDNFPDDKDILADPEGSLDGVLFETAMWDDPDFLE